MIIPVSRVAPHFCQAVARPRCATDSYSRVMSGATSPAIKGGRAALRAGRVTEAVARPSWANRVKAMRTKVMAARDGEHFARMQP